MPWPRNVVLDSFLRDAEGLELVPEELHDLVLPVMRVTLGDAEHIIDGPAGEFFSSTRSCPDGCATSTFSTVAGTLT